MKTFRKHADVRNTHKILVGKPEGLRQFGITRIKWGNNIKTDFVYSRREADNREHCI